MRLVIAVNYLLLIGYIDILPALFDKVILPVAVRNELGHPKAPFVVRNWITAPPPWVDIRQPSHHDPSLETLDAGKEAAISLAVELRADLLLMDDEEGVIAARGKGLEVTGTLVFWAGRRNVVCSISPRPSTISNAQFSLSTRAYGPIPQGNDRHRVSRWNAGCATGRW